MATEPEKTDAQDGALTDGDEWMHDREVFAHETFEKDGVKSRRLYVPERAKARWSDKNPLKFTPEVALEIISHLMVGATKKDAAEAAGITRQTIGNWLKWAEDKEFSTEELRAFAFWCNRGRALRRIEALRRIQKLGADDWKAEAWLLERTSDEYRQHTGLALENPDGTALNVAVVPKSSEEMIRAVQAMQAALAESEQPTPGGNAPGTPDAT